MLTHITSRAAHRPVTGFIIRHASSSTLNQPIVGSEQASTPRRRRKQIDPASFQGADLVAPPDPISNIRPIIYASTSTRPRLRTPNSPYSTGEFPSSSIGNGNNTGARLGEMELEWKLQRERVDAANHRFWAGMNQEFNAQLEHRLSLLPSPSDPPSAEDIRRREDCLTQFYADWQVAKRDEMGVWVKRWWREVWDGIKVQGRVHLARLFAGR